MAKHCDRLKEALEMRGITQSVLSYKTNISKSSISHYLKGDYEPKMDRIEAMAKALHVSKAWLKGFDVSPNEETAVEPKAVENTTDEHEYVVYHRDGKRVKVRFDEHQMKIFQALVDSADRDTESE